MAVQCDLLISRTYITLTTTAHMHIQTAQKAHRQKELLLKKLFSVGIYTTRTCLSATDACTAVIIM